MSQLYDPSYPQAFDSSESLGTHSKRCSQGILTQDSLGMVWALSLGIVQVPTANIHEYGNGLAG